MSHKRTFKETSVNNNDNNIDQDPSQPQIKRRRYNDNTAKASTTMTTEESPIEHSAQSASKFNIWLQPNNRSNMAINTENNNQYQSGSNRHRSPPSIPTPVNVRRQQPSLISRLSFESNMDISTDLTQQTANIQNDTSSPSQQESDLNSNDPTPNLSPFALKHNTVIDMLLQNRPLPIEDANVFDVADNIFTNNTEISPEFDVENDNAEYIGSNTFINRCYLICGELNIRISSLLTYAWIFWCLLVAYCLIYISFWWMLHSQCEEEFKCLKGIQYDLSKLEKCKKACRVCMETINETMMNVKASPY